MHIFLSHTHILMEAMCTLPWFCIQLDFYAYDIRDPLQENIRNDFPFNSKFKRLVNGFCKRLNDFSNRLNDF